MVSSSVEGYFDQLSLSVRRCLRVFAIMGLALAEVSCDTGGFIADQSDVLDTRNGLYLIYRVSGFQAESGVLRSVAGQTRV